MKALVFFFNEVSVNSSTMMKNIIETKNKASLNLYTTEIAPALVNFMNKNIEESKLFL